MERISRIRDGFIRLIRHIRVIRVPLGICVQ